MLPLPKLLMFAIGSIFKNVIRKEFYFNQIFWSRKGDFAIRRSGFSYMQESD
jgi:hypothetical protein